MFHVLSEFYLQFCNLTTIPEGCLYQWHMGRQWTIISFSIFIPIWYTNDNTDKNALFKFFFSKCIFLKQFFSRSHEIYFKDTLQPSSNEQAICLNSDSVHLYPRESSLNTFYQEWDEMHLCLFYWMLFSFFSFCIIFSFPKHIPQDFIKIGYTTMLSSIEHACQIRVFHSCK
jgi:hypothetical protein